MKFPVDISRCRASHHAIRIERLICRGHVLGELTRETSPYLRRASRVTLFCGMSPHEFLAQHFALHSSVRIPSDTDTDTDTFLKYGPNLPASVWSS